MKKVEEKRQAEVDQKEKMERIRKEAQDKVKGEVAAEKLAKKLAKTEAVAAAVPVDDWSSDQQKQMETKMREVPQTVPIKERWI